MYSLLSGPSTTDPTIATTSITVTPKIATLRPPATTNTGTVNLDTTKFLL